jgi:hypothetical protein
MQLSISKELPEFRRLLPHHMQQDMQQYSEYKKSQNKKLKESRLIHTKVKLEDELSDNKLESSTGASPTKLKKRKSTIVAKSGKEDAIKEKKSYHAVDSSRNESATKKRHKNIEAPSMNSDSPMKSKGMNK